MSVLCISVCNLDVVVFLMCAGRGQRLTPGNPEEPDIEDEEEQNEEEQVLNGTSYFLRPLLSSCFCFQSLFCRSIFVCFICSGQLQSSKPKKGFKNDKLDKFSDI